MGVLPGDRLGDRIVSRFVRAGLHGPGVSRDRARRSGVSSQLVAWRGRAWGRAVVTGALEACPWFPGRWPSFTMLGLWPAVRARRKVPGVQPWGPWRWALGSSGLLTIAVFRHRGRRDTPVYAVPLAARHEAGRGWHGWRERELPRSRPRTVPRPARAADRPRARYQAPCLGPRGHLRPAHYE